MEAVARSELDTGPSPGPGPHPRTVSDWLDRPISSTWCVLGWVWSTVMYVGIVGLLGPQSQVDTKESVFSTWSIAHGRFGCAYPPAGTYHFKGTALIPPVWPLLSGGVAALAHIGTGVPFPSRAALGGSCTHAITAMSAWSVRAGALEPTMKVGLLGWLVLLAGMVALLRSVGRGRRRWEPATVALMACAPPVLMPILQVFHPQDLVVMGLVLGALACLRLDRWAWAGALLGLAVVTQQFAWLVLAPVIVIAPAARRARLLVPAAGVTALVVVPFIVASAGRALRPVVLGSGNTPSTGGTVLWETHLQGTLLVVVSRLFPILASVALAWWAARRLGPRAFEPVPLLSLLATCLCFRLAFEENLFGYYLMAVTVMLLALAVAQRRCDGAILGWIALTALVFNPIPMTYMFRYYYAPLFMVILSCGLVAGLLRHTIRWHLLLWLALAACFDASSSLTGLPQTVDHSTWLWQIIFVLSGVALSVGPLLAAARRPTPRPPAEPDVNATPAMVSPLVPSSAGGPAEP
jgi:hypothetical protein